MRLTPAVKGLLVGLCLLFSTLVAWQWADAESPPLSEPFIAQPISPLQAAKTHWQQGQLADALMHLQNSQQLVGLSTQLQTRLLDTTHTTLIRRQSCVVKLQPVLDSWASWLQLLGLLAMFEQDTRLSTLPICWQQPLRLPEGSLQCQAQPRLACNLLPLHGALKDSQGTHLLMLAEQGKANVHNGVMFLDRQDSYSVFVHELAHFAGLLDEYALSQPLATEVCQLGQQANLHISSHAQSHMGVAVATCDAAGRYAYKKGTDFTFMQYHDVPHIPADYLTYWHQAFLEPAQLVPFYVNLAQQFADNDQPRQADFWQKRSQVFWQVY